MAKFYDIILKPEQPNGIQFVDRIDEYSDGHARDNGAIYRSRNEPIKWPTVETGEVINYEMYGEQPFAVTAPADEAIWEDGAIRSATADEIAQLTELEATAEANRISALAAIHGDDLIRLDVLMKQIGMTYPTDPEVVEANIGELVDAGSESALVVGLAIERQWERLAEVQDDLLDIWDAIKAGE